jgi:hypothetical protein
MGFHHPNAAVGEARGMHAMPPGTPRPCYGPLTGPGVGHG